MYIWHSWEAFTSYKGLSSQRWPLSATSSKVIYSHLHPMYRVFPSQVSRTPLSHYPQNTHRRPFKSLNLYLFFLIRSLFSCPIQIVLLMLVCLHLITYIVWIYCSFESCVGAPPLTYLWGEKILWFSIPLFPHYLYHLVWHLLQEVHNKYTWMHD